MMKCILPASILIAFGLVALPGHVRASGVAETLIPSDVEWFVHIDAETLRSSETGAALIRELQGISPLKENPQIPIDPVLIINGLRGLTAFGTLPGFEGGADVDAALLIEGTPELMQVFRGLVAGFRLEKPEAVEEIQTGSQTILKLQEEAICASFLEGDRIVLGKSLGSVVEFLEVYAGNQSHISLESRFPSYSLGTHSGIFAGAFVEGLDSFQNLPAQARILQLTRAVSVQLGELDSLVRLIASLDTDSEQTAQQVQEVLQGIVALMMITQNGNPDIASLIQSTRVQRNGASVSLGLSYPVEDTREWIKRLVLLIESQMAGDANENVTDNGTNGHTE